MATFSYRIGRVQKPHGLGGDLLIKLFRPRRERSNKRRLVKGSMFVALTTPDGVETTYQLVAVRFVDPTRVVVSFEGIDRTAAEGLVGRYVDVDPLELPPALTDFADRTYDARAIDDSDGSELGRVIDIRDNGAQPLLLIETPEGEEVSVPYVDVFVAGLDGTGAERVLRLTPIPGLFDLE